MGLITDRKRRFDLFYYNKIVYLLHIKANQQFYPIPF